MPELVGGMGIAFIVIIMMIHAAKHPYIYIYINNWGLPKSYKCHICPLKNYIEVLHTNLYF